MTRKDAFWAAYHTARKTRRTQSVIATKDGSNYQYFEYQGHAYAGFIRNGWVEIVRYDAEGVQVYAS